MEEQREGMFFLLKGGEKMDIICLDCSTKTKLKNQKQTLSFSCPRCSSPYFKSDRNFRAICTGCSDTFEGSADVVINGNCLSCRGRIWEIAVAPSKAPAKEKDPPKDKDKPKKKTSGKASKTSTKKPLKRRAKKAKKND